MNHKTFTTVLRVLSPCLFSACLLALTSCWGGGDKSDKTDDTDPAEDAQEVAVDPDAEVPTKSYVMNADGITHTYLVADHNDQMKVYKQGVNRDNCFFVISKKEYRLYVYERAGEDTVLVAHYPVCYARNLEAKTRTGDNCTPECSIDHPFFIQEIIDASSWEHDFGDGRGSFLAYGAWFMRLNLSKSDCNEGCRDNRSIGIHGSTGNAASVPGRDSEGCIRLRDADLLSLESNYAQKGTPVVVKGYTAGKLPFELAAQERLGDKYQAPRPGNPLLSDSQAPSSQPSDDYEAVEGEDFPESYQEGGQTHASDEY